MNWKRLIGVDNLAAEYAYARDAETGYTSARRIAEKWVPTTCGYCSVGCGMEIGVRDNRAVAVRPLETHPVNRGKLCPKGLSEHHTIHAENRLRRPLLRKNGKLVETGWDEALHEMVTRFRATQARHGRDSLGVLSTGQLVTEEFYALGKLVQLGFGTNNYDGNTTLCMATAVSGYKLSFGSDGPPGSYEDLEKADVILLIGANIAENHPILCQYLEANPRKTLIVADPRVTKTAMMADLHLPLKPRSDLALLNGIAHILVRHNLVNREYIDLHTTGFDDLSRHLENYPPHRVCEITGLTEDQLYKTALLYGRAKNGFIGWTMGINHSTKGTETVNAICNLALLTGHIGRAGAAPFSITGQCNAMGTRETGFTSSMPGYRKFDDPADRAELAALWNIDEARLPAKRGLAYPDIVEGAVGGKIQAMWIIATNPLVSFPNQAVLRQALSNLEFLVVQDGYHPTPTTEFAHLVLPAAIWGEKEGTYTNSERRVSKVNRAVDPPGEARSDFDIFLSVAGRMGCREELFPGWKGPRDAFEEWRRVSRGRFCDYSGISYELLAEAGGIQWPFPAEAGTEPGAFSAEAGTMQRTSSAGAGAEPRALSTEARSMQSTSSADVDTMHRTLQAAAGAIQRTLPADAQSARSPLPPTARDSASAGDFNGRPSAPSRLYADGRFQTADGRARLICADWEPFPEQPNRQYPLVLNTGRTVEHWHTRTKTREVPILERLSPAAWLEMNPRDAHGLGLRSHDRVDVLSRRGRVRGVELRLTEIIAPGQVFMPFHYYETNVNDVTQSAFDPISREPNYKQCAVRVERTGATL